MTTMTDSEPRFNVLLAPVDHLCTDTEPPCYWIQDDMTMDLQSDSPGRHVASVCLTMGDTDKVTWTCDVLDTEAVIVLTVATEDAASIVARLIAALNASTV